MKTEIVSSDLASYRLNKTIDARLARVGELRDYMAKGGKALEVCRLDPGTYASIAEKVKSQSGGKQSIVNVRWCGLPIRSTAGAAQ